MRAHIFLASHACDIPQVPASRQRTRGINVQTLNAVTMISLSTQKITARLECCAYRSLCLLVTYLLLYMAFMLMFSLCSAIVSLSLFLHFMAG